MLKLVVGWLRLGVGSKEMRDSNLTNNIAFHDYIVELGTCVLHDYSKKDTWH
jgi:hypothetical protein